MYGPNGMWKIPVQKKPWVSLNGGVKCMNGGWDYTQPWDFANQPSTNWGIGPIILDHIYKCDIMICQLDLKKKNKHDEIRGTVSKWWSET